MVSTKSLESGLPPAVTSSVEEILGNARADLIENTRIAFSETTVAAILKEARTRLLIRVVQESLSDFQSISQVWHQIVVSFHRENHWGFAEGSEVEPQPLVVRPKLRPGFAFFRAVAVSMILTKGFLIYFGGRYSSFPGEGYGYGLIATCLFSLGSLSYLAWKYRNTDL